MLTAEDLKAISQIFDEKLDKRLEPLEGEIKSISDRLDDIEERLEAIEENTAITRDVTNQIVEWIDVNFRHEYPFPVDKAV